MGLPEHVAIIMDGNGRWAKQKNLPRVMGHRQGAETADAIVEACTRKGIKNLTLYSFSTENWKRSKGEVNALMKLIENGIRKSLKKMRDNNIRFNVFGRLTELPESLQDAIKTAKEETASNSGLALNFALNYGGRQEILDAVRELYAVTNKAPEDLTEEDLAAHLYTAGFPDPTLVIRTSGEFRISNFLLWQSAYSEFYITDKLWPDFNEEELDRALDSYGSRERRFGE